jgi:hypothetical protein
MTAMMWADCSDAAMRSGADRDAPARSASECEARWSSFAAQLDACRAQVLRECSALPAPYPAHTLFFSVGDGLHRAHVVHARGDDFARTWSAGVMRLRNWMALQQLDRPVVRVDWVEGARCVSWERLVAQLDFTRRNHFRLGLALDSDFACAFTEQELNAHGMLSGGSDASRCAVHVARLQRHAQARTGHTTPPTLPPGGPVYLLSVRGVFCGIDGVPHLLGGSGLDAGRRAPELDADLLLALAEHSADHLARRAWPAGDVGTPSTPCPASALSAMIDVWELTRDASLRTAIERGVEHLTGAGLRRVSHVSGVQLAFAAHGDERTRLLHSADCLRALLRYDEATGTARCRPLLGELAAGLVFTQNRLTGRFHDAPSVRHLLPHDDAGSTPPCDGSAIHALLRLHAADGDPRWLEAAGLGVEFLLSTPGAHREDRWLPAAIAEFARWRPLARCYRLGLLELASRLDCVRECKATDAALLGAMLAAQRMLAQIDEAPHLHALLHGIDRPKFERVLVHRAHYQLNAFFWPETALYVQPPAAVEGAFFQRQQGFVADLGETARSVSALLDYRRWLLQPRADAARTGAVGSPLPTPLF